MRGDPLLAQQHPETEVVDAAVVGHGDEVADARGEHRLDQRRTGDRRGRNRRPPTTHRSPMSATASDALANTLSITSPPSRFVDSVCVSVRARLEARRRQRTSAGDQARHDLVNDHGIALSHKDIDDAVARGQRSTCSIFIAGHDDERVALRALTCLASRARASTVPGIGLRTSSLDADRPARRRAPSTSTSGHVSPSTQTQVVATVDDVPAVMGFAIHGERHRRRPGPTSPRGRRRRRRLRTLGLVHRSRARDRDRALVESWQRSTARDVGAPPAASPLPRPTDHWALDPLASSRSSHETRVEGEYRDRRCRRHQ